VSDAPSDFDSSESGGVENRVFVFTVYVYRRGKSVVKMCAVSGVMLGCRFVWTKQTIQKGFADQ
jgi:hypothetical protein